MAVDTRDKRASALREGLLPLPDGLAFNQGDRQQILWQYRGINANPPTPSAGSGSKQFLGEIQSLGLGAILDANMGVN